jgi:hypothetical protein
MCVIKHTSSGTGPAKRLNEVNYKLREVRKLNESLTLKLVSSMSKIVRNHATSTQRKEKTPISWSTPESCFRLRSGEEVNITNKF